MASRSLPPGRRCYVQVRRGLTRDVRPTIAEYFLTFYNQHLVATRRNFHVLAACEHNRRRRPLTHRRQHQHERHAASSSAELNDLSCSPLRSRDIVDQNERDRALRLYQKIISNSASGEGLGQPVITATEGCLDILARLEPRQKEVEKGEGTMDHTPADMALNLINHLRTQGRDAEVITGKMYEFAIQALAKQQGRAEDAYELLNEYISTWESKGRGRSKVFNDMQAPNSILMSSVINSCAKDPNPMGGDMADELLRRMMQLHETYPTYGVSTFAPNVISFTAVIDGWSRRGDAEKAEAMLDMMTKFDVKPSIVSYNAVIAAWSRVAKDKKMAAEHAEKIFQRVLDMPGIEPDVHSYASLLLALTNSCNQPHGVERASDVLRGMEQKVDGCFSREVHFDASTGSFVIPNAVCYNTVIHGHTKLKRPMEAEEVLCRMVERHEQNPLEAPAPNARTLNAALSAWAQSGRRDSGRKAQDLLEAFEGMARVDGGKIKGANAEIEATVRPDIFGYNIVLDGWRQGSSIESALDAEKLLQSMEQGERFVMPDRTSYNTVIDAFCKAGRNQQRHNYNGKGRHRKENLGSNDNGDTLDSICVAQRAEGLLYQMDAAGVQPCSWSFNTVLHAWARSGYGQKAADHASALLFTMEKHQKKGERRGKEEKFVSPDARSYSAVIDAIARSGDTNAPDRAAAILSRMEANGLTPNVFTLNGILNCWAKSSRYNSAAATEADIILRKMEENDIDHNDYPRPDLISYCLVATAFAWNRSNANKAVKAREVLNKMLYFLRHDEFHGGGKSHRELEDHTKSKLQSAFNSVLSACAHMPRHSSVEDLERAREIALQTYDELHRSNLVHPNEETYFIFLLVCRNLFAKKSIRRRDENSGTQEKLVERIMQDCYERGFVTDRITKRLEELRSVRTRRLPQGLGRNNSL